MKIIIIEPYFEGSHKNWTLELQKNSSHEIELLTLPGRYWKWRMHGGAIKLAQEFNKLHSYPDLIIASDMLNLPVFNSIIKSDKIPTCMYFHENQITYPWSPMDRDIKMGRDHHYGFINYSSALASNHNFFNTDFHKSDFLSSLKGFLLNFPDYRGIENIDLIEKKSTTLHLGLDLKRFDRFKITNKNNKPIILWNHRWEHDKNPNSFKNILLEVSNKKIDFNLILLGKNNQKKSGFFDDIENSLKKHIIYSGYCEKFEDYAKYLWKSDILMVTSIQDFFGISIAEAAYCDTFPLLPNRLSYPEIYNYDFNKRFFYNDEDDAVNKLIYILKDKNLSTCNGRELVKGFDWQNMIEKYDEAFERVAL